MDHETSMRTQAAERYLLGDLSPADRDAFEQHYFQCAECAEEIRLTSAFLENGRAVLEDGWTPGAASRRMEWRDWFARMRPAVWVPAAACLALMTFTGYQNAVVIPGLRSTVAESSAAQVLPSVVLLPPSRGEVPSIAVPRGARFFELSLEVISAGRFDRYECALRSASGRTVLSIPVPAPDASGSLNLLIPAAEFGPGGYEAVLSGAGAAGTQEVGRYGFRVNRQ